MSSAEYRKQWQKDNPEKLLEYQRRYRKKNLGNPDTQKVWNKKQRDRQNAYDAKMRDEAIDFLGGKCIQCGFSDKRALQFDHINGGGSKEYRDSASKSGYHRKKWKSVINGEGKFQLLCANCNWIKRYENGEVN